jgi:adenylate cyclase
LTLFSGKGKRNQRVRAYLKKRARARAENRPQLDCENFPFLFCKQAIVFTDTADFTTRTARDGILHFLMIFDRATAAARKVVKETGGQVVKVEGDSLLLRYDHPDDACRGVAELEKLLASMNKGRPENEQVHFSYGIGYGDVLDLDDDMFGLEVNLASKLGEDLAEPGEALLTPGAAAALSPAMLRRVVEHRVITLGRSTLPVQRLKLRSGVRQKVRNPRGRRP